MNGENIIKRKSYWRVSISQDAVFFGESERPVSFDDTLLLMFYWLAVTSSPGVFASADFEVEAWEASFSSLVWSPYTLVLELLPTSSPPKAKAD